ncbi:alkaline shock response membrane anchor protein AmaP [Peptostreptococcus stomatis]|uniref:alkaline shock response membrane anchor protein AmaP n=1 Tax=Peptostreptococcus stomatis TaxID=341694 RepID=UPI0003108493|nr:alkaline shock response membrane anchor protein AmaP [Peptostreptococcus stomatis]
MSTFRKIINLIYFLILVCLLVVLYSMAFDLEFMKTLVDAVRDNAGYTMLVNIGLVLVLGVTCLRAVYTLFKKSYDSYIDLFEDEGSIRISDKSIERTIRHAAGQIEEIDQVDISVKARNKNDGNPDVKINIKCGLDYAKYMQASYFTEERLVDDQVDLDASQVGSHDTDLAPVVDNASQDQAIGMTGLTNMIQEELHKAVENFIGQRVDQINIKFYDVEKKKKDNKPKKAPKKSNTGSEIRGKVKRVK